MQFKNLEKALAEQIMNLKSAELPNKSAAYEEICFDGAEPDNAKWLALISEKMKTAKTFEIHCWNEETEWIELALQYGALKDTDWRHGKIITGLVTEEFTKMLLKLPKPTDTEIYNKMTPFFNVFLDDSFQSCHYGMENYVK